MTHPYAIHRRTWLYVFALAFAVLFAAVVRGQSATERIHRFNISDSPPSSQCDEAREMGWFWWDYDEDTDGAFFICTGTGGWKQIGTGGGGSGDITAVWTDTSGDVSALTAASGDSFNAAAADSSIPCTQSSSLPGTCTEGQCHQDTDSGGTETYVCTATNTWTKFIAPTDNVATATALAANGANCSAGSYARGVDASGAAENCTADNADGGAAATATALAANGANCSAGSAPLGVDASGAVETCTDYEEDLSDSAGLRAALSDETGGTGVAVFAASPALTGDPTVGGVSVCLENGTNCPGAFTTLEYNPNNYPPAGDKLLSDEFTSSLSLTWTERDTDSAATSVTVGTHLSSFFIDGGGTVDDWNGATTTVPADSGADWFMVAKVNHASLAPSATMGCGISLITGGSAATPSEINSMYFRFTSGTAAAFEHTDHDDYEFTGSTSLSTDQAVNTLSDANRARTISYYIFLHWIDATEDIAAGWSWAGYTWGNMTTDTTVDGYPVAAGIFARDNATCIFEWVRFLDTDVDPFGSSRLRVGG